MTGTQADSTGALVDVTELVLPLAANSIYLVFASVSFKSAATTTGLNLGLVTPTGSDQRVKIDISATVTASATTTIQSTFPLGGSPTPALSSLVSGSVSAANTAVYTGMITGQIITGGTAGNAQVQFATEIAASAVTLQIGSRLTLVKIA